MTQAVGSVGYPPAVQIGKAPNPEKAKYDAMWQTEDYRRIAPGEALASVFLDVAKPPRGAHVLDFGAGTGRGAVMLALMGGQVILSGLIGELLIRIYHEPQGRQLYVLRERK